jgi:hypothetical protein
MAVAEEWRPAVGFPAYEVSSEGRVRRAAGGRGARAGRLLAPLPHPRGYLVVHLSNGSARARRRPLIHSLVAAAFLGDRPPGLQVNHKNGDKRDPRAANLEYATPAENRRHARALGLVSGHDDATIAAVRREVAAGSSQRDVARRYGLHPSTVSRVVRWLARAA